MADVILIGASVRALADSARRAGFSPLCVDLFRDADLLSRHADSLLCPFEQYPEGFLTLLESLPPLPVIYSGGFENYPSLIDQLQSRHPIWGNPGSVLRRVRDPFLLSRFLKENGLQTPAISRDIPELGTMRWLRKRKQSSAGRGIRPASSMDQADDEHFFQELIPGNSYSATFVVRKSYSTPDQSAEKQNFVADLVGVSEQLIGCDWLNAKPYWYCGNIGPIRLPPQVHASVEKLGELAREFELRGCFGVDMMINGRGVYPIEVNPRYTASMEIFERHTLGLAVLGDIVKLDSSLTRCIGKAVWHTPAPCRVMTRPEELSTNEFADLPHAGQEFGANEPLVSIFVEETDRDSVESRLREIALEIPRVFRLQPI